MTEAALVHAARRLVAQAMEFERVTRDFNEAGWLASDVEPLVEPLKAVCREPSPNHVSALFEALSRVKQKGFNPLVPEIDGPTTEAEKRILEFSLQPFFDHLDIRAAASSAKSDGPPPEMGVELLAHSRRLLDAVERVVKHEWVADAQFKRFLGWLQEDAASVLALWAQQGIAPPESPCRKILMLCCWLQHVDNWDTTDAESFAAEIDDLLEEDDWHERFFEPDLIPVEDAAWLESQLDKLRTAAG